MDDLFSYYRLISSFEDGVPRLASDKGSPKHLFSKEPINDQNLEPLLFKIGKPVPKNPKMVDLLPSVRTIVSKKLYEVLKLININGVQLLPIIIQGNNNDPSNKYWALHTYCRILCLDLHASDCRVEERRFAYVKKLVLDNNVLEQIPLENRLIFRMKEDSSYELFHKSIVDQIIGSNCAGLKFIPIEEWNEGSFF